MASSPRSPAASFRQRVPAAGRKLEAGGARRGQAQARTSRLNHGYVLERWPFPPPYEAAEIGPFAELSA